MRARRQPFLARLSTVLPRAVVWLTACGQPEPGGPAEPAGPPAAAPTDSAVAAGVVADEGVDAPDLQGALAAAFERGVVAAEGGNGWQIDPFVAAWVVAAVRHNGDRWLTRYSAAGADGVQVEGWQVRVPPTSPLRQLGLRDGDVLETVSGVPASDLEALRTRVSLADRALTLSVYRVDVTLTLHYQIVPGLSWDRTRGSLAGGEVAPSPGAVVAAPFVPVPDQVSEPGRARPTGAAPSRPPSSGAGGGAYGGGVAPSPGAPRPTPGGAPAPVDGADPVSCSSASACTVDRAYFRSAVANPAKLQSQANIVPAIANDVHSGYKIKSVKSGSAVHKLGFRSGDKVTHVNGADLTNDLEALALYAGIDSTHSFRVRYIRAGSVRTKLITLR